MGVSTRSKELVEGFAHDESFAAPLPRRELNQRVVRRGRKLEREHSVSDRVGSHTGSIGTRLSDVNTDNQRAGLPFPPVEPGSNQLGNLIRARREAVRPKLSQGELGRLVGLDQRTISEIETGQTQTLQPGVANQLPGIIGVTMAELVRALGYDLPTRKSSLDDALLEDLERAPEEVLNAVRLAVDGWKLRLQESARSGRQ